MVNNYLIIGADSELAQEFIKINSTNKVNLFKISRNPIESDVLISDYFNDVQKIIDYVESLPNCYIIFFNGYLAENRPVQYPSNEELNMTFKINFHVPYFLTNELLHLDNIKKYVYISSLAAVKPRLKNFVYGSMKRLLEQSIKSLGLKNVLFLRFGKIRTSMSTGHKDMLLTMSKKTASELIFKNIKKTGISYPNFGLWFISIFLKFLPIKLINFIEIEND